MVTISIKTNKGRTNFTTIAIYLTVALPKRDKLFWRRP